MHQAIPVRAARFRSADRSRNATRPTRPPGSRWGTGWFYGAVFFAGGASDLPTIRPGGDGLRALGESAIRDAALVARDRAAAESSLAAQILRCSADFLDEVRRLKLERLPPAIPAGPPLPDALSSAGRSGPGAGRLPWLLALPAGAVAAAVIILSLIRSRPRPLAFPTVEIIPRLGAPYSGGNQARVSFRACRRSAPQEITLPKPRGPLLWPLMPPPSSDLKIFSGNAHPGLAARICDAIGAPGSNATVTTFPDGESFVKINENIRGCDVFIVQPTSPPTNNNLMELLIMVDAARRASAERITAVIPFFGYARQDRKDQPRVPITAKLVANLLVAAGVTRVLTVDLHAAQIQGFFDIPVDHLYAAPVILKHLRLKGLGGSESVVVSPDVGGIKMSDAYARALDCPLAIVAKRRINSTVVEAHTLIGEVEGRDVLLVDDLTESAGTLTAAAVLLKDRGARSIRAAVSHGVLTPLALDRLEHSSIAELICTDSVPMASGPRVTSLSIADLLAEAIKRIHFGESVTSLFET